MTAQQSTARLLYELESHLRSAGVTGLPEEWFSRDAAENSAELSPSADEGQERLAVSEASGALGILDALDWPALELEASGCTRCRLCEGRTKVVFGTGRRDRPLVAFVGEGPGADEDRVGEPFVGKAGMLLTAAITKGMGLRREDVYICNVVKCRPPQNRAPLPDEVESCSPFLLRQLELAQPKVIVTLGSPAQQALSGVSGGITKIRGNWQSYKGIPLMPTFHPAYLLRNPAAKRPFWEDLKEVMRLLGLEVKGKGEL